MWWSRIKKRLAVIVLSLFPYANDTQINFGNNLIRVNWARIFYPMFYQNYSDIIKKYEADLAWPDDLVKANNSLPALGIVRRTRNLQDLAAFDKLEYLHLYRVKLRQIRDIPVLPSVRYMLIRECDAPDFEFVRAFPNLIVLEFWDGPGLTSTKGIGQLAHVEILNLANNLRLKNFAELESLSKLQCLGVVGGNYRALRIENLNFIGALKMLKEVHLGSTRILSDDLTPLADLPNLQYLSIPATNAIEKLAYLAGALPNTKCDFFAPYYTMLTADASLGTCKTCGGQIVCLVGRGKRQTICKDCNKDLVEKQERLFEEYREKGRKSLEV